MANDWIKMRINLAEDPAVLGIATRTKLDRYAVVGRLHTLWGWADENSADGFLAHATAKFIDEKVGRKGFAAAMADPAIAWLTIDDSGVRFPKFERHNGESAKSRALATERQRDKRTRETLETVTPLSRSERDKPEPTVTPPSRPHRDATVTREEKSITTTTTKKNFVLRTTDLPNLAKDFPDIDLVAQHRLALVYVRKQRGPTAEVTRRFFIEDWLPHAEKKEAAETSADLPPEGWETALAETAYGPGGNFETKDWAALPPHIQAHAREQLAAAKS